MSSDTVRGRAAIGLAAIAIGALALSGCSGTDAAAKEYGALSVQPLLDGARAVQRCVAEKGFYVDLTPTGAIQYTEEQVPDDQVVQADAAIAECTQKYGRADTQAWPRDELPRLYALELQARKCVLELGISVSEAPSLQRFIDIYGTDDSWSALSNAVLENDLDEKTYTELVLGCPDPAVLASP